MREYMKVREFVDGGYLHEVNRIVLHPLGLALAVEEDDDGNQHICGVQDYRDDPDGMAAVSAEWLARMPSRVAALGFMVEGLILEARIPLMPPHVHQDAPHAQCLTTRDKDDNKIQPTCVVCGKLAILCSGVP